MVFPSGFMIHKIGTASVFKQGGYQEPTRNHSDINKSNCRELLKITVSPHYQ